MVTSLGGRLARRAAEADHHIGRRQDGAQCHAIAAGIAGSSTEVSPPIASVETATRPTASANTGLRTDFKSTYDDDSASPKTSGASTSTWISSGSLGAEGPTAAPDHQPARK